MQSFEGSGQSQEVVDGAFTRQPRAEATAAAMATTAAAAAAAAEAETEATAATNSAETYSSLLFCTICIRAGIQ